MLEDVYSVTRGSILDCDICVVGAGAAGLAIADQLSDQKYRVVILESGGLHHERKTQELYAGEVTDPSAHEPLDQWRERRFGGTTTIWEGRLVPFDPIDFEERDYVPHSGWPFNKQHLDPYYAAAQQLCEAGTYTDDLKRLLPHRNGAQLISGFSSDDLQTNRFYLYSPPTNFAKRFSRLKSPACGHRILLHANCIGIETDPVSGAVTHLRVASSGRQNEFSIRARCYILATGGLEVPRLLLASNVGNEHDVVGRYYQAHVATTVPVRFTRPIIWNYETTVDGVYAQRAIALAPHVQRDQHILNNLSSIRRPTALDATHGNAVLSGLAIARALRCGDLATVGAHARNLPRNWPTSLAFAARVASAKLPHRRKSPPIIQCPSAANRYTLRIDSEQVPTPDSRVTLSETDVDELGMPRLKVDWRYTELDDWNWRKTVALISEKLEAGGAGRIEMTPEYEQVHRPTALAAHHIGAARMHTDPRKGVVDANCKVHGLNNLYIASSAVFPTGSHANPTLTILALALRLADHVNGLLA